MNADNTPVTGFFSIVPGSGTAVPQYSDGNNLMLYPNPAKGVVHVQWEMDNAQWDGATVEVLDMYGKRLQTVRVSSEITTLDVSNLANGMYFVRVTKGADAVSKLFVKE